MCQWTVIVSGILMIGFFRYRLLRIFYFYFLLFFYFFFIFFFFNDTATTEIYTLSLHDALPIYKPKLKRNWSNTNSLMICSSLPSTCLILTIIYHPHYWNCCITLYSKTFTTIPIEIGRAHVWTPVTDQSRMPSSAWKKKNKKKQKKKNKKNKKN